MRYLMTLWGLLVGLAGIAIAETYVVNPDGSLGDFPTIQAAVDFARDGDIIELGNGTFTGDGNRDMDYLGKAITIRSQGGPELCTIDCEGSASDHHRAFVFRNGEGPESVLEGVTITHGYMAGAGGYYWNAGSGVYCGGTSPTILDCAFVENGAGMSDPTVGGALFWSNGSPHVQDCTFIGNVVGYGGGAVYTCDSMNEVVLTRCTFAGNRAELGGAIHI